MLLIAFKSKNKDVFPPVRPQCVPHLLFFSSAAVKLRYLILTNRIIRQFKQTKNTSSPQVLLQFLLICSSCKALILLGKERHFFLFESRWIIAKSAARRKGICKINSLRLTQSLPSQIQPIVNRERGHRTKHDRSNLLTHFCVAGSLWVQFEILINPNKIALYLYSFHNGHNWSRKL